MKNCAILQLRITSFQFKGGISLPNAGGVLKK